MVINGCPDIPDPQNGNIDFTGDISAPFDVGTTATYSCDQGYSLVGDSAVRSCLNAGLDYYWSGDASTCERKYNIICSGTGGAVIVIGVQQSDIRHFLTICQAKCDQCQV